MVATTVLAHVCIIAIKFTQFHIQRGPIYPHVALVLVTQFMLVVMYVLVHIVITILKTVK